MLRNNVNRIQLLDLWHNMLSSVGDGLEYFFRHVNAAIKYNDNPFKCPLPSYMEGDCSLCNSETKRNSCEECVSAGCGWCSYGPNCVNGTHQGPVNTYSCPEEHWNFETCKKK